MQAMYLGARNVIKKVWGPSSSFCVRVVVHQGSTLCPYLLMLMDDFLTGVGESVAPHCMFATDIVQIVES